MKIWRRNDAKQTTNDSPDVDADCRAGGCRLCAVEFVYGD
ncbi:MAG: 2Fe-2S iron-sulfur cluster binding domain-containing protein [Caldilineaceae bacterium]|nr:2Fe-2S iron-sulfur cluster binding domain-containing protein [Caldilineaceae bacterium]